MRNFVLSAIILVLTFTGFSFGQTSVTGTIIDANSNFYANGTVSAYFLPSAGQGPPFTVSSTTSSSGAFSITLKTAGAYQFTVCAMPVDIGPLANRTPSQVCAYSSPVTISGGSIDVSSVINAVAPILGPKINTTALPAAGARGELLASTGVGTTYAPQSKSIVDVRDAGVDCTGVTDSGAALNAVFTSFNGKEVDVPWNCQIQTTVELVIQSQSGWVLRGLGTRSAVGGAIGPTIFGCNPAATGPVLYINRSGYGRVTGLSILPKGTGPCAGSTFTQSVQIDSTGNPGVTTHDIILDNNAFTTGPSGGAIVNYIGVSVTDGGKQNGEMIKVSDNYIHCQNSSGSIGINILNGTSDNDLASFNHIANCNFGIRVEGNIRITNNLLSSNGTNSVFGAFGASIYTPFCSSGQISITYNESDNGGPFIDNDHTGVRGCNSGFNVVGNMIGIGDIASGNFIIDVGGGGNSWVVTGNTFLVTTNTNQYIIGSQAQPALKGPLGTLFETGNFLRNPTPSNTLGWEDLTRPFQAGENRSWTTVSTAGSTGVPFGNTWGTDISSTNHMYFAPLIGNNFANESPYVAWRSWTGAAYDDWFTQSMSSATISTFNINHQSGPATTQWFNWDGQTSGLVSAQLTTPDIPAGVTPNGTTGATTYTYSIVAFGQVGRTPGGPTRSTATGNAVLSSVNFNRIGFTPFNSFGANKWCIWRTVGGATQGKIGCVNATATAATGQNNNQYYFDDTGLVGDGVALPVTNTTGQWSSTVPTGLAPLSVASTTPVANLTVSNHPTLQDCGTTSTCANTQKTAALIVRGSVAFPTAATVTVTSLPFTSAASYSCTAGDVTTAAGVVNATTYTNGTSVTFTETGGVNTDTMRYICVGF